MSDKYKNYKLIMENWRRYVSSSDQLSEANWRNLLKKAKQLLLRKRAKGRDFPSDSYQPAGADVYDVHQGGATSPYSQDQRIDMSKYSNLGAPIKPRNAIEYDPPPGESEADSLANVNMGKQGKRSSDRELNLPHILQRVVGKMIQEISVIDEKLSELEAADTITYQEAELHRQRMSSWHAALGQADTLDINILLKKVSKVGEDIDEMLEESPGLRDTEINVPSYSNLFPSDETGYGMSKLNRVHSGGAESDDLENQ